MRGDDMGGAALPRGLRQQPVSGLSRRRGQPGFGLAPSSARAVRQVERAREPLDVSASRAATPQAMIDGDGNQARTAR